jgi:hypothetical protein
MRAMLTLPYEEKKEDDHPKLDADNLNRVVLVFKRPQHKFEEVKKILNEFDGVEKIEQVDNKTKVDKRTRKPMVDKKTGKPFVNKKPSGFKIRVTFEDDESAKAFLEKEVEFKGYKLKTELLKKTIHASLVRSKNTVMNYHYFQVIGCLPLEEGKEDNYLFVYGIGEPTDEELQEFFMDGESESESVESVKTVSQQIQGTKKEKRLGVLVQFKTKQDLVKFTELENLEYKERVVKYHVVNDVIKNNELKTKKVDYAVDDGPTTQELTNRRLIVVRLKEKFTPEVEKKFKEQFPTARNVRHCRLNKVVVVTFPTAEAADKAIENLDDEGVAVPIYVMKLAEYLEERGNFLEKMADSMERSKVKYEEVKKNVTVEEKAIKFTVPKVESKAKQEKAEKTKKGKDKDTKGKKVKEAPAKPLPTNHILRKRAIRGRNIFDVYIGVRGFNQFVQSMGKPTDMDLCNYFIHNHVDVADVKFLNFTDIVFAKFRTVDAAEAFISLKYHVFYGNQLKLVDVPDFLRMKSDLQKNEVGKVLLGKRFGDFMLEGKGGEGGAPAAPTTPEMVLIGLKSKQSVESIKDLIHKNLHLEKEDIGQIKYVKGSGTTSNARIALKLDANAVGYFVKKWNDEEVSIAGETVKAEYSGPDTNPKKTKATKRSAPFEKKGAPSKKGRKQFNRTPNKKAKLSLEDY